MKNLIYECGLPNILSGGFGDRIIGMISCLALSKKYNCEFYIRWIDTNIDDYFKYRKFDENIKGSEKKILCQTLGEFKEINFKDFNNIDNFFLNTNQNFWQFIIKENYEKETLNLFKELFSVYFKPRKGLVKKVEDLIGNKEIVGIQLRFGDVLMDKERKQINNPQHNHFPLGEDINRARDLIIRLINENKRVFITSDINLNNIIDISKYKNVIYQDKLPIHIERSQDKNGLDKCYIDFIALTKCKKLYITYESNFGRCPALISNCEVQAITSDLSIKNVGIKELAFKFW